MSYVEEISGVKSVNRKTVADGDWFQDTYIKITSGNLKYLAEELDSAELTAVSSIKASAESGFAASAETSKYDFPGLEGSAKSGQAAFNQLNPTTYTLDLETTRINSNYSLGAYQKVSAYDLDGISNSAKAGSNVSATLTALKLGTDPLSCIAGSAKSGQAAYDILVNLSAKIETLTSVYKPISASAKAGADASAALTGGLYKTFTDFSTCVETSAGRYWPAAYSYVVNSADNMNDVVTYTANSAAILDNITNSAEAFLNSLTEVCGKSAADWNKILPSAISSYTAAYKNYADGYPSWTAASSVQFTSYSAWDKLLAITASAGKWNAAYSAWTSWSAAWPSLSDPWTKNSSAKNFNNLTATLTTADKWDSTSSTVKTYSASWTAAYNYWTKSGTNVQDTKKAYDASSNKFNDTVTMADTMTAFIGKLENGSGSWNSAYETLTSSNSAKIKNWDTAVYEFVGAAWYRTYQLVDSQNSTTDISPTGTANSAHWTNMAKAYKTSATFWNDAVTSATKSGTYWEKAVQFCENSANTMNGIYNAVAVYKDTAGRTWPARWNLLKSFTDRVYTVQKATYVDRIYYPSTYTGNYDKTQAAWSSCLHFFE